MTVGRLVVATINLVARVVLGRENRQDKSREGLTGEEEDGGAKSSVSEIEKCNGGASAIRSRWDQWIPVCS